MDSQHRVRHELIEFLMDVFKGDDFLISAFVSECSATAVKLLSASRGTVLSCLYFSHRQPS